MQAVQISKSEIIRTGHHEREVINHGWAGGKVEFLLFGEAQLCF